MAFDYTSRDYDSIRQDLLDRASRLVPEWTSRDPSDFGMLMVELWAQAADVLHYYIDRAANEAFLDTATQRESVLAFANLFDYTPRTITAASATVTLNTSLLPTSITIPAGTAFYAPPTEDRIGLTFYTVLPYTASSASNIVLPVVEGMQTTGEIIGTSTGNTNQRFFLFYKNVDIASVKVYVNEGANNTPVYYTYLSSLVDAESTQRSFTLETDANGVTYVVFGNSINGRIPTTNATIQVDYRRTNGATGNVGVNSITQIKNTFTGSQYLSISSSTAASGGAEAESIESMRANIPRVFSTLDRAVSLQDFKDLALNAPAVAKATAYNPAGSGASVVIYPLQYINAFESFYTTYNTTTISSSAIKQGVVTYFAPRTLVGASVTVSETVEIVPMNISASVSVLPTYVRSEVLDNLSTAINNLFTFESVSFGQRITKGELYRTIMAVNGVDYISGFSWSYGSGSGTAITQEFYEVDPRKLPCKGTVLISMFNGLT